MNRWTGMDTHSQARRTFAEARPGISSMPISSQK